MSHHLHDSEAGGRGRPRSQVARLLSEDALWFRMDTGIARLYLLGMVPQWIIEKKRDGKELAEKEIRFFIDCYATGTIPDYQMSALAMAIHFQGNELLDEVAVLTDAMMRSGDVPNTSSIKLPKNSFRMRCNSKRYNGTSRKYFRASTGYCKTSEPTFRNAEKSGRFVCTN